MQAGPSACGADHDAKLTGKDAEAAACDARTVQVVTGIMDDTVIDQMIALARTGQTLLPLAAP
jgi:hypothetical protein